MPERVEDRSDPRTGRARALRRAATPAEKVLWTALKRLDVDGHFRRQVPIGPYFADFAHHRVRIIVELDGEQHGYPEGLKHDAARTVYLERAGYRVLRFWNHEVRENLHGVVETVLAALNSVPPTPRPSPPQAGGGEMRLSEPGCAKALRHHTATGSTSC